MENNNQVPQQCQCQVPPQGQYQIPPQGQCPAGEKDELSTTGIVLTWLGVLLCGCIGILVISILYYTMKGKTPNKAAQMNKHSWIAFLVAVLLWVVFYALLGAVGVALV